jgi:hypothetical protein
MRSTNSQRGRTRPRCRHQPRRGTVLRPSVCTPSRPVGAIAGEHLLAALAVWKYAADPRAGSSATRWATIADAILVRCAPRQPDADRHRPSGHVSAPHRARARHSRTPSHPAHPGRGGRPVETWHAVRTATPAPPSSKGAISAGEKVVGADLSALLSLFAHRAADAHRVGGPFGDEDRATEEALRDKREKGEKCPRTGTSRASLAYRAPGVGGVREAECRDDD